MWPQCWIIAWIIWLLRSEILASKNSVTDQVMIIQYGRHELLTWQNSAPSIKGQFLDYTFLSRSVTRKRPSREKRPRGRRRGYSKFQRRIRPIVDIFHRRQQPKPSRIPTRTVVSYQSSYNLDQCLNFSLWNARSMNGKIGALAASIMTHRTDVCMLTESWTTEENGTLVFADFCSSISGFTAIHVPRVKRRGGGVALLHRTNMKVKRNTSGRFDSMEVLDVNI